MAVAHYIEGNRNLPPTSAVARFPSSGGIERPSIETLFQIMEGGRASALRNEASGATVLDEDRGDPRRKLRPRAVSLLPEVPADAEACECC